MKRDQKKISLGESIMNAPIKFGINPFSGLYQNARKLEGRTNRRATKVIRITSLQETSGCGYTVPFKSILKSCFSDREITYKW